MPSTERTALARLEELGDVLADERERTGAPPDPGQDPSEVAIPPPRSAGLLRSNVVVATGTALSRLTGLLRVIVFGYVIGQGALADAYTHRQRDAEHRLRAAARRRAVGDARAAVHVVRRATTTSESTSTS